jgi:hypothetical protein
VLEALLLRSPPGSSRPFSFLARFKTHEPCPPPMDVSLCCSPSAASERATKTSHGSMIVTCCVGSIWRWYQFPELGAGANEQVGLRALASLR